MNNQSNLNLTPEKYQEIKTKLESENIQDFPPLFQQARNLIKQVWLSGMEAVKGKPLISSIEKAAARMNICESCEFFTGERCKKCGCYMKTKVHIDATSCPLNKWWPDFQNEQVNLIQSPIPNNSSAQPSIKNHAGAKEFTDLVLKHKEPGQPKNFTFQGVNYYVDITEGTTMVYEVQ